MSFILFVLNFITSCRRNRPLDQVSLVIHPFHLSQVYPEIRGKDYMHLSLHVERLVSCEIIVYVQVFPDILVAQEVPCFLFLPGNIQPSS